MTIFSWNSAWETGNALIDDQHRELLSRFEALANALLQGTSEEEYKRLCGFMAEYAETHFLAEEALMLQRTAEAMGTEALGITQDAALIRGEVGRCRRILDQMAGPSGATLGEALQATSWADLEADLLEGLSSEDHERLVFEWPQSVCGPVPRRGLARAIRTLLSNALEATPRPGSVTVRALEEEGKWRLDIVDQGSGITPDVLAHAGEPFFSTKPTGSGMGLGLFLALTFAEQLGGDLTVASQLGNGTRVQLCWPQMAHG